MYRQDAVIAYMTVKTMCEMLQILIPDDVNPAFICTSYSHDKDKYNKALKLSKKERQILSNLSSDKFHKCDTPLLYKLCQYFDCVTAPLEGWGKFNNQLQNIGDAVEAIVRLRYENIRNPTKDFKERFDRMVEIAKLVDKEISTDGRFEDSLKSLCVDKFDDRCIGKCKTEFQQMTEEANGSAEDDVLEENEPMSFDEDYHTNVWQKQIVLSPALFGKTKNHPQTEVEANNNLAAKLGQLEASKDQDALPRSRSRKRKIDVRST